MKNSFEEFKKKVSGKKVAVVGIGVSNTPLIRFLLKLGAKVTAFDKREEKDLGGNVDEFKGKIGLSLGENYLSDLKGFDVIFRTPGMRPDTPELIKAREEGAFITSEIKELIRYCRGTVIGITGSDGKSTTTTMTYELLKAGGHTAYLGGNIGFPLFDIVENIREDEYLVLELSSFQLMDMDISPEIAVVTNLSPNHLDVHKDMAEYINAKKNIFLHQDENGVLIINEDNDITSSFKGEEKGKLRSFSSEKHADAWYEDGMIYLHGREIVKLSDMKIRGVHNAQNLCAAMLATDGLVPDEKIREFALGFTGVHHRCEFVRELDGVRYYNDSIASSPTRTLATVRSFPEYKGKINIILGGYDKNLAYDELAETGSTLFRNVVLVGKSKDKIKAAFDKIENKPPMHICETFEEAVEKLKEVSKEGDISLLSPASASFDMFRNFEVRGNTFTDLVKNLK